MKRFVFAAACLMCATAQAQPVVQPAEESADQAPPASSPQTSEETRQQAWEQPAYQTVVTGQQLREEERIGDYHQPRWTASRRFPSTRIYVLPRGTLNGEYWITPRIPLNDGDGVRFKSMYELEYGLGYRLQLDLYLTTEQKGVDGPIALTEEKIELRYALADWGVIPANPTLYAEVVRRSAAPPKVELKLLLGDEIAPHWHWGANLVWERAVGGNLKHEYAITAALSYSAIDMYLSLGVELVGKMYDHVGSRFDPDQYTLMAGPSIQWRPVAPMRILLVALFGANHNELTHTTTPLAEPTMIVSWQF